MTSGTGLGLAVVHGATEAMDGHLEIGATPDGSTSVVEDFPAVSATPDEEPTAEWRPVRQRRGIHEGDGRGGTVGWGVERREVWSA